MKKKILPCLLVLLMFIVAANMMVVSANSVIIPDGSFEEENAWSINNTEILTIQTVANAKDGNKVLKIAEGADNNAQAQNRNIAVNPNSNYRLEYYTKSTSTWNAIVQILDNRWTKLGQNLTSVSTDGAIWNKVTLDFTTNDITVINILILGNYSTTPVYFDDFVLYQLYDDEVGTIINGGFEYGSQLWDFSYSGAYEVSNADKFSGEYSLYMTGAGNYHNARRVITVEESSKYILSFYAKNVSNSAAMVSLFSGTTSNSSNLLKELQPTASEWKLYTIPFESGVEATEFYLEIKDGGASGAGTIAYFDDFALTKIEDGKIIDGGFENGGIGWSFPSKWNISDETANTGKYSAKLTGAGSASWTNMEQTINVTQNTDYAVSFYAKSDTDWGAQIKAIGKTDMATIEFAGISKPDRWAHYEMRFNSGANEIVNIAFMDQGGTVYIDDVEVSRVTEVVKVQPITSGVPVDFTAKDSLTVGYIGGSITDGTGASSTDKRWANQITTYLQDKTGLPVSPVYAGIGGTGSDYGLYRLYDYVLKFAPDLVFVEYAVNDTGRDKREVQKNIEGIIRQILSLPKQCSVILVFTTTENFNAVADTHQEVANYYGVPTINIQDYIVSEIEKGTWSAFSELSADGVHPNDYGYSVYADYIKSVMNSDFGKYFCINQLAEKPMTYAAYNTPRLASVDTAISGNGWTLENGNLTSSAQGASFTYEFTGKSLGFTCSTSGSIDISIDGMSYGNVALYGAPYRVIADNLKDTAHTVTVTNASAASVSISKFFIDDNKVYEYTECIAEKVGKIVNGGFEYGSQLWSLPYGFEVTAEDKAEGKYSLAITGNAGIWQAARRTVNLEPNSRYSFSFYGKAVSGQVLLKIFRGDNEDGATMIKECNITSTDWLQTCFDFETDDTTAYRILIMCAGAPGYVDGLSVDKYETEKIVNGSFESGLSCWSAASKFSASDEKAHSGLRSAKLTSSSYNYVYMTQTVDVAPNTDYKLTYYVNSQGSWNVVAKVQDSNGIDMIANGPSGTGTWECKTISFNSGNNSEIRIGFMDNGSNAYIDDVTLERESIQINGKFVNDTGVEIKSLTSNGRVTVIYNIVNPTTVDKTATAVIALYKDGKLVTISMSDNITIGRNGNTAAASASVIALNDVTGCSVKAFILKDMSSLSPYGAAIGIE